MKPNVPTLSWLTFTRSEMGRTTARMDATRENSPKLRWLQLLIKNPTTWTKLSSMLIWYLRKGKEHRNKLRMQRQWMWMTWHEQCIKLVRSKMIVLSLQLRAQLLTTWFAWQAKLKKQKRKENCFRMLNVFWLRQEVACPSWKGSHETKLWEPICLPWSTNWGLLLRLELLYHPALKQEVRRLDQEKEKLQTKKWRRFPYNTKRFLRSTKIVKLWRCVLPNL